MHDEVEEYAEFYERDQQYGALETAQREYQYYQYRRDGNARNQREVGGGDCGEVVGALRITREVATHGSVVGVFCRDQPALAENFVGNGLDFVEDVETLLTFVVDFGVGDTDGIHGVTAVDITLECVEIARHFAFFAHHPEKHSRNIFRSESSLGNTVAVRVVEYVGNR